MCTDLLEVELRSGTRLKACYVIPNFQNPSGATLSVERRRHLAALADRYGFVIIEDDPYAALRFRGEQPPAIRTFSDRVVHLGTASKLLAPGLRVGWLTGPEWIVRPFVRLKQAADLHTASLNQLIVRELLGDPSFVRGHLASLASVYGGRCEALQSALPPSFTVHRPDGGMFLWAQTNCPDATAALPAAVDAGVAYVPGAAFFTEGSPPSAGRSSVRLSFATVPVDQLSVAADRLAHALAGAVA